MKAISNNSSLIYFLLQCVLAAISPLTSFIIAIRFFKNNISQIFIVVFGFYFGFHCGFIYDLMNHYESLPLYRGRSFYHIITDPRVYLLGSDYYHVIVKYLFTRFTMSRQLFGGYSGAIYTILIVFTIRQLESFYRRPLAACEAACLLMIAFVIEFYWYQGFRFWPGAFFFAGFYLKYINTAKIRYLVIASMCFVIHFSLITLVLAAWAEFVLCRLNFKIRFSALLLSLLCKIFMFDFASWVFANFSYVHSWSKSSYNANTLINIYNHQFQYREVANVFYQYREDFLMLIGTIVLLICRRQKIWLNDKYWKVLGLCITLATVAHIGYSSMAFYGRFYRMAVLMLYIFIFIVMSTNYVRLRNNRMLLFFLIFIALSYALLTQLVQQRYWLFTHPDLLIGNVFTDFDGNMFRRPRI